MTTYANGRKAQPHDEVISAHGTDGELLVVECSTRECCTLGYDASRGTVRRVDGRLVIVLRSDLLEGDHPRHYWALAEHLLVVGDS